MSIRHDRDLRYQKPRTRTKRPKTFKTEESANAYAKEKGIEKYKLVNLRSDTAKVKKLRVVAE